MIPSIYVKFSYMNSSTGLNNEGDVEGDTDEDELKEKDEGEVIESII